jgi:hypothetical protein
MPRGMETVKLLIAEKDACRALSDSSLACVWMLLCSPLPVEAPSRRNVSSLLSTVISRMYQNVKNPHRTPTHTSDFD